MQRTMPKDLALVVDTMNTGFLFLVPGGDLELIGRGAGLGEVCKFCMYWESLLSLGFYEFFIFLFVAFSVYKIFLVSDSSKPSCLCKFCIFVLLLGSFSFFSLTGDTTDPSGPRSSFSLLSPSLPQWLGAGVGQLFSVFLDIGYIRRDRRGVLQCGSVA